MTKEEREQQEREYGYIKIKLDELLKKEGISKNKLSYRADMHRDKVSRYCNNDISILDVKVLARICHTLECRIEDLIEYVPPVSND